MSLNAPTNLDQIPSLGAFSSVFDFVSCYDKSQHSLARISFQALMAQNTLSPSPHLQVEERDQAGQVVARYVATGSNGRIDVIVRFLCISRGVGKG